jgi:Fe-S oxidoreductase/nitrate reductase gamma subunit
VTPTRVEFLHFATWEKALFYVLTFISIGIMAWQIWGRVRLWRQGKPIDWKPKPARNLLKYVLGQKKVVRHREKSGAPMHLLLFYGFLTLFVGTTLLGINTYSPVKFHQGAYYIAYEFIMDIMGVAFVVGCLWALIRRLTAKPRGLTSTRADFAILALLLIVGLTGFVLEAGRMANNPKPFDTSAPVGFWLSGMIGGASVTFYKFLWWFHMVWVFVFFATLPQMRIRHIVMAMFSTGGKSEQPWGELKPISMEEVEATGKIGVETANDYSRWHLMSLDACMECGRCTDVCPANRAGKLLDPKLIVQNLRGAMGTDQKVTEALDPERLWECTTCNACVEACPVVIRHVDVIVDARRNLVAEGQLTGSAATMLRQTASTGNAWGAPSSSREDWMKDLEVPLAHQKQEFDVLFWVGCAGATDPGAIRTTRATAKLLAIAGVDFACLGEEEKCTGDPARRVGDEFLFQERALENVGTFGRYRFKRIVTACPHCFNTLKNEYGQFKGRYEVLHHSQLFQELIQEGRLKAADTTIGNVVFHDPCYLGRVNMESEAPRTVAKGMLNPINSGRKTQCCGAGGGRMWMEEPADQRPGAIRAKELLETGASTVALGCPFCRIMLDASIKQVTEEEIRLIDLAEILQEAN